MNLKPLVAILSFALSASASAVTLQEAIDTTVNTHPDVLAAGNERNAVSEEINQAKAGYYPTLDLTLGSGFENSDNSTTRGAGRGHDSLNRNEASLQLRQMLFDGMATKNEVKRQKARTNARAYTVFGEAENAALRATDAYIEVLRRQKLVDLAQQNYQAHEKTHDQIRLRSDHGVGRRSDMDQSQGRLALARRNLLAEESNLRDAKIAYLIVVGIEADELIEPSSPQDKIPATVDEAISQALENHPTLNSAKADVASAHAQHDTASSPFYPRFDFELGTTADNDIDGVRGHNHDVTAMFRMRYNLLNGGRDSARKKETAHLINQAAEIRNNTHRQVEESVRLSWNALVTVNGQMDYFRLHVASSEKSRNAYQQQFGLGQRTLLDLLDSENEVFVSSQALVNAEYDQLFAMYRIINSMGALLETMEVALPSTAVAIAEE
jgi:adhesin transport system outer membrane protein